MRSHWSVSIRFSHDESDPSAAKLLTRKEGL
jgi:hypothetical protein